MPGTLFSLRDASDLVSLTATLAVATAARQQGQRVVLHLYGEGVYLTDAAKFLRWRKPVNGYSAPTELWAAAVQAGVEVWVAAEGLDYRRMEASPGHRPITSAELAAELPAFDRTVTL